MCTPLDVISTLRFKCQIRFRDFDDAKTRVVIFSYPTVYPDVMVLVRKSLNYSESTAPLLQMKKKSWCIEVLEGSYGAGTTLWPSVISSDYVKLPSSNGCPRSEPNVMVWRAMVAYFQQ